MAAKEFLPAIFEDKDFVPIDLRFPDREDIIIYPISDLHVGSRECMVTAFLEFLRKLEKEPNSYIIILGDIMNNSLKNSVSNVYEEVVPPREQKQFLIDKLGEVAKKILCVVPGNHENRSDKEVDNNPLWDIAYKLGIEDRYRPNASFISMRFGDIKGAGDTNPSYTICVTHGAGGGIYTGAAINRSERFAYVFDGIDVFVVGHSHKVVISKPQKIVFDPRNKKVTFKPFLVVNATSWVRYGGYALRKMLMPGSHALQEIQLSGKTKQARVLV